VEGNFSIILQNMANITIFSGRNWEKTRAH